MKKLLLLLLICTPLFAISQEIKRQKIYGKILVEGDDIEGITVYNSASNKGTVTDEKGEFTISVALNDLIEIRAIEYQNFDVKINKDILESKEVHVFLIEEVNKLDEIVITTKKLSGNLKTDINRAKTFSPKLNTVYFGIQKNGVNASAYKKNQIKSIAANPQTHTDGLNIVNIVDQLLIPLFRSEVKDKKAAGISEVPATSIKYYFGSNFLVENFNIPEHRVEEFIRYVEDAPTFDFDLLNYGREIEFLELLNKKSKEFLKTKVDID